MKTEELLRQVINTLSEHNKTGAEIIGEKDLIEKVDIMKNKNVSEEPNRN